MENWKRRRQTLSLVAIVVILAMLFSFTFAWFAQLLVAKDNRITAGSATGSAAELWAQSAQEPAVTGVRTVAERYGKAFADIAFPSDGSENAYAPTVTQTDALMNTDYSQVKPGTLYKLVRSNLDETWPDTGLVYNGAHQNGANTEYNRLLNEGGLLPGVAVTRRLIVRNTSTEKISYTLSFADPDGSGRDNTLAEAIRVDGTLYRAQTGGPIDETDLGDGKPRVSRPEKLNSVSLAELKSNTVSGQLAGKAGAESYDVYELTFTFLGTASEYYADRSALLDVNVLVNGGDAIRHVKDADELNSLLYDEASPLSTGETIALDNDITLEGDFITSKLVNLDLQGHKLRIKGVFVLDTRGTPDETRFATVDIDYGGSGSMIVGTNDVTGDPGSVGIWAPKTAVRFNNQKQSVDSDATRLTQPAPESLNVRVFNGVERLNDGAVMPASVKLENMTVTDGDGAAAVSLNFTKGGTFANTLTVNATATAAAGETKAPVFYAYTLDKSVALVADIQQSSTLAAGPTTSAVITVQALADPNRDEMDALKSTVLVIRAGDREARVALNIGVGVKDFDLAPTLNLEPGTGVTGTLTASNFTSGLVDPPSPQTRKIATWESSDESVVKVEKNGDTGATVKVQITDTDYIRHGSQATITATSLNGVRKQCVVTVGTAYATITLLNAANQESTVLMPTAFTGDASLKSAELHVQLNAATAAKLEGQRAANDNIAQWSIVSGGEYISLDSATGMTNTVRAKTPDYGKTAQISVTLNGMTDTMDVIVGWPVTDMTTSVPANIWNGSGTASITAWVGQDGNQPSLKQVTWSLCDADGNPATYTGVTVAKTGDSTASITVSDQATIGGTVYLKATSVSNPTVHKIASFQTGHLVAGMTVAVTPGNIWNTSGTASVSYTGTAPSRPGITWSLCAQNGTAASYPGVSINASTGAISANTTARAGQTVYVKATANDGSGKTAIGKFQNGIAVTKVTVTPPAAVPPGTTANASFTIEPANASVKTVTWKLEGATADSAAPAGLSIDENGKITATAAAPAGQTFRIVATSKDGNNISGAASSVTWKALTGVTLDRTKIDLWSGSTTLTATITPTDATDWNGATVTWSSNVTSAATVSPASGTTTNGKHTVTITRMNGGSATITCTVRDSQCNTATASCSVYLPTVLD